MSQSVHKIPTLDRKGLRHFGLLTGAIVAGLFGLFFPWVFSLSYPMWPWIVFGVLGIWAIALPDTLSLVHRSWMQFGLLVSKVTTPVLMGAVFYLIIAPMAIVMRMAGRDPLHRRLEKDAASYRIVSNAPHKENLKRPF